MSKKVKCAGKAPVNIRGRYQATRGKIARLRREVKLQDNPQYRVSVRKTAGSITLERETYQLVFDKRSAMVRRAVIEGRKLNEVMLPHLLAIDSRGRRLRQADSSAGDLKVRHEKFSVFLEGYFTLDGQRVPIVYEMDRMTGTTFCTMDVPGPLKVRRLTLEHSLGKTPDPLDTFYAPHHYLRKIQPYKPVVLNEHNPDEVFEKDTMMYWTNHYMGMQVYSITWDKGRVAKAEKKYRYGTGEVRDGASWADLTFFSTGTKKAVNLPDGYRATCAFSLMPFKKWRPMSDTLGSTYMFPPQREAPGYRKGEEIAAMYNYLGRTGTTLMCHGEPHPCYLAMDPKFTKWQADAGRENGIRTVLYIERSWVSEQAHPRWGLLTKKELREGRQELVSHWGPKDNGAARWGKWGLTMCSNYELWRVHLLTMIDYFVGDMNFDGVYLDTSFVCSCQNTHHGESPDESTSVRGSMIFQQDLRLLIDDYTRRRKREHVIINHYWDQHAAPIAGLSDFTLPGEQDANKLLKRMTPANHTYGYSAIPNGVNFIWYSSNSYDYTSPQIYNDAADCGGLIWLTAHVQPQDDKTVEAQLKHTRHMQPLVQYNLRGSRPVHRFTSEYAKIFKGGDPSTRAMLYVKDDSALVFLVNDGPKAGKTSFSFKPPKPWRKCLVLNAANMTWHVLTSRGGRISMKGLDCTDGPLPLIVRPYPTKVAVYWCDKICRSAAAAVKGKSVTVTATGVAGASSACFMQVPPPSALARGDRLQQKICDEIYCVPLVFNEKGEARLELRIVRAPKDGK